jgi:hypothetical protein
MHGAWLVLLAGSCLSFFPFSELHASMRERLSALQRHFAHRMDGRPVMASQTHSLARHRCFTGNGPVILPVDLLAAMGPIC